MTLVDVVVVESADQLFMATYSCSLLPSLNGPCNSGWVALINSVFSFRWWHAEVLSSLL